jgi:predicted phosphodiesterase
MSNVLKKHVDDAADLIDRLNRFYGLRYIKGNHELLPWENEFQRIVKQGRSIVFCHGHIPLWGREKSFDWMDREAGSGCVRRSGSWLINKYRDVFGGDLSKKDLANLATFAKMHKCDYIILGHKHPNEVIDVTYRGIRIIVLPPGITKVRL